MIYPGRLVDLCVTSSLTEELQRENPGQFLLNYYALTKSDNLTTPQGLIRIWHCLCLAYHTPCRWYLQMLSLNFLLHLLILLYPALGFTFCLSSNNEEHVTPVLRALITLCIYDPQFYSRYKFLCACMLLQICVHERLYPE